MAKSRSMGIYVERVGWLSKERWVAKSIRMGWLGREGWVAKARGIGSWLSREDWVAESLVCLLPTAALCVGNQTTLKIHYWGT